MSTRPRRNAEKNERTTVSERFFLAPRARKRRARVTGTTVLARGGWWIFSHAEPRRARREEDWIFSACSAAPREPLPRVLVC